MPYVANTHHQPALDAVYSLDWQLHDHADSPPGHLHAGLIVPARSILRTSDSWLLATVPRTLEFSFRFSSPFSIKPTKSLAISLSILF